MDEINIRIIQKEEGYTIIYNGQTIAECLSFDEIAELTVLEIAAEGEEAER